MRSYVDSYLLFLHFIDRGTDRYRELPPKRIFLSNLEAFFYEFDARTTLVDIYLDFRR